MNKENLLGQIRFAREIVQQQASLNRELAMFDRPLLKIPRISLKYRIPASLLLGVLCSNSVSGLLFLLIMFFPIYYPWLFKFINQIWVRRRKAANAARIREIESRIPFLDNQLHQYTDIPYPYAVNPDFLERSENYLLTLRADTLQECINLFEEKLRFEQAEWNRERRHRELLAKLDSHHADNMRNNERTREILRQSPYVVGGFIDSLKDNLKDLARRK
jgi:hypothetical protein